MSETWVRIHRGVPRAPGQSLDCMNWDLDSPNAERVVGDITQLEDVLRERGARDIYRSLAGDGVIAVFDGPRYGEPLEIWARAREEDSNA